MFPLLCRVSFTFMLLSWGRIKIKMPVQQQEAQKAHKWNNNEAGVCMSKQFWHISPFIFQVAVAICRAVSFPSCAVVLLLRYFKAFHCWFKKEALQTKNFIVLYKTVVYSHSIQGHHYFSINIVHSVLQQHFRQPRFNLVFAKKEQSAFFSLLILLRVSN